ncbi:hypothetical protein Bca4012_002630 [Brassica carinata]|uniref:Uncharacterized protein n=1 Tax=Brassica carinata TaxID=52824 RepID=A0A8X7S1Y2_BRACI|nr:hypothetical protein Bca52824_042613 [Brassica carinata]
MAWARIEEVVDQLALEGDANSAKFNVPMKHHKDCNFSYASLKTQVRLATEARDIDAKCPVSCATKEDRRRNRADMNIWSETAKLSDHLNMSSSGSNE